MTVAVAPHSWQSWELLGSVVRNGIPYVHNKPLQRLAVVFFVLPCHCLVSLSEEHSKGLNSNWQTNNLL